MPGYNALAYSICVVSVSMLHRVEKHACTTGSSGKLRCSLHYWSVISFKTERKSICSSYYVLRTVTYNIDGFVQIYANVPA